MIGAAYFMTDMGISRFGGLNQSKLKPKHTDPYRGLELCAGTTTQRDLPLRPTTDPKFEEYPTTGYTSRSHKEQNTTFLYSQVPGPNGC